MNENLASTRVASPLPAMTAPGRSDVAETLSAACMRKLIDELDVGMLVCTANGLLVHANAAGQQELRWGSVLTTHSGQYVCAADAAQRPALANAMAGALNGRRQLVMLNGAPRPTSAVPAAREGVSSVAEPHSLKGAAERLMVSAQPLPGPAGSAPRVLLLLGRRSMAPGLVVEMLCSLHAITSAEKRVLDGLLHGQQVESLAEQFGVKVSTVRSQVAALRNKLGVHRISDALRLAAELPPMASALRYQAPAAALPALPALQ